MVNQRQRQARRRFKCAHPELLPTPEPTPPKDPSQKKKKKSNFKKKKSQSEGPTNAHEKSGKRTARKHPLRVPGMKPGDCCFICKADNHIAKNCPEKEHWEKNKICLLCRRRGHGLKNCPYQADETTDKKLCYNCGQTGHSLFTCPQPRQDGGTKFATCFICNQRGHLSRDCAKNSHGIYPKGGCCKICRGITHLARDCPSKTNGGLVAVGESDLRRGKVTKLISGDDLKDDFISAESGTHESGFVDWPRGKVTKLISGDDLEDDFMLDDTNSSKKDRVLKKESSFSKSNSAVKPKKNQGTKVVNFIG